jgi:GT2 family glycosyltransferase
VVLVNYATWPDTARLTRQLLREGRREDVEVVVVDNHSPPHRLMLKLRRRPGVSLRRWGRNRGFGRAVNEGVRLSRGRWLLLLNPDTSVTDGFLGAVLRLTETLPTRTGIVGFRLLNEDGTPQPSVGRYPRLADTLRGLLRSRSQRKYLRPQPDQPCDADWLSGCCLLIREECFSQLGGFDPSFFLYYEDVDLCLRARAAGWAVRFEPSVAVTHRMPLHSRRVPPHIRLFTRHALLTYAGKHWPLWQMKLLAALVRVEAWLRGFRSRRQGDRRAGQVFDEMGRMALDLFHGRREEAAKRVARIARQEERRLAALTLRRHPEPQPGRPAERMPEERDAVRAAGHADHRG